MSVAIVSTVIVMITTKATYFQEKILLEMIISIIMELTA